MPVSVFDGAQWVQVRNPQTYDSATWRRVTHGWVYDGSAWRLVYVRAIPTGVTLTVPSILEQGIASSFSGSVTGPAGEPAIGSVTLEFRPTGGSWSTLATRLLSAQGTWTFSWSPDVKGDYEFRAQYPGNEPFVPGTSSVESRNIGAAMSLAAVSSLWDRVALTITAPKGGADSYTILRDGTSISSGTTTLTFTDLLRNPSATYAYTVQAIRGGSVVQTATASATTPAYPAVSLTATAAAYNSVNLSWTARSGSADQAIARRGGSAIYTGTANSYQDTGLSASSSYSYTVQHLRSGVVLGTGSASATTPARPTEQRFWESRASGSRTYNGSNGDRGVSEMYFGYYSSNHGQQKSRFWFDIPADMRNCVSIDRIDLAFWGQHTYNGEGTSLYLAIIHDPSNIGSTDVMNWTFSVPGDGWVGPHEKSGWCIELQGLTSAGRPSMAEEFRVQGAVGFQLVATTSAQSGYGYCQGASQVNYPRMRVWYTVNG